MTTGAYNGSMADENKTVKLRWGDALKRERDRRGLSQADLAAAVGTTQSTVAKWEKRSAPLTDELTLQQLMSFLDAPGLATGTVQIRDPLTALVAHEVRNGAIRRLVDLVPDDAAVVERMIALLNVFVDVSEENQWMLIDIAATVREHEQMPKMRILGDTHGPRRFTEAHAYRDPVARALDEDGDARA
jgi:transcriptional regulator with XRE-family HTH domain